MRDLARKGVSFMVRKTSALKPISEGANSGHRYTISYHSGRQNGCGLVVDWRESAPLPYTYQLLWGGGDPHIGTRTTTVAPYGIKNIEIVLGRGR